MEKIIFATNNPNKTGEIKPVTEGLVNIVSLAEEGISIKIDEPHHTLQENALEKANVIHKMNGHTVFSEDTGLEVDALHGEPGVKSARYAAGENYKDNIEKLLARLGNNPDRRARFRTVICLIRNNEIQYFEGVCEGKIIAERRGTAGFGYDPVFIPNGSSKSFAEMAPEEKNRYSHRKKAVDKLLAYLIENYGKN